MEGGKTGRERVVGKMAGGERRLYTRPRVGLAGEASPDAIPDAVIHMIS
jgi:hypothetical protein